MKELTLNRLRNTSFPDLFKSLALGKNMKDIEIEKLLSLAVVFINTSNQDISRLGYRIIVFYCNLTKNYKPLYDIAINTGLIPIVKSIEGITDYHDHFESSFFNAFNSSFSETYRSNKIYLSDQQRNLLSFFEEKEDKSISVIAPTSYGKSELIISTLKNRKNGNICILVPTKALLAQTKRRIVDGEIENISKIITHPEMFVNDEKNITAILTQERLIRLLQKYSNLNFDMVFIDEAHNLLENDNRNILLASAISILEKRNPKIVFKFLTPFLVDNSNLEVKYSNYTLENFKITEYIKTERFYIFDFRKENKLKFYDHFLNHFFYLTEEDFIDDIDLILQKSSGKNIIYLNKPSDIEEFSQNFSLRTSKISSDKIEKACAELGDYLHTDYFLINCLKNGFIYHHGSVPDNVRIYIEHLFSEEKELEFVVTSSTLLEGVNIPADKLFLLDNKKGRSNLSPSQFKNLIGRVCRFSEVFSNTNGSLEKLEPEIYLIGSNYISSNANIEKFIGDCTKVDKLDKDLPKNILLENVEITDENCELKESADEFIENFEPGTVPNYANSYAQTEIGKLCFANNITEIDIILYESSMEKAVQKNRHIIIDTSEGIFNLFSKVFLPFIKSDDKHNNLKRLSYPESQRFYQMFLNWRIKSATYNEMIISFLSYWKKVASMDGEKLIYVGRWGDKTRDGYLPLWTNIKEKDYKQRINLAIVRIKEEQDFLDNILIKFIEVLNDLDFIEKDFYEKIKYGTSDKVKITLIKNGLSMGLANLIVNSYGNFIEVNIELNNVYIKPSIIESMIENKENEILIYEVKYNTKQN